MLGKCRCNRLCDCLPKFRGVGGGECGGGWRGGQRRRILLRAGVDVVSAQRFDGFFYIKIISNNKILGALVGRKVKFKHFKNFKKIKPSGRFLGKMIFSYLNAGVVDFCFYTCDRVLARRAQDDPAAPQPPLCRRPVAAWTTLRDR